MKLQSFNFQKRSKLASHLIINNPISSKTLLMTVDLSSFRDQISNNLINSGMSDDGKFVGIFLEVLVWIISD